MRKRLTFLSHFVLCLAVAAGAFFATYEGVPQLVWASDLSHMTSAMAALFIVTAGWLGWQAWSVDSIASSWVSVRFREPILADRVDSSFGHLAKELFVALGIIGTGAGLALQGKALMAGAASFGALSTAIFSTIVAVGGYALVAILTHNLDRGIERARR